MQHACWLPCLCCSLQAEHWVTALDPGIMAAPHFTVSSAGPAIGRIGGTVVDDGITFQVMRWVRRLQVGLVKATRFCTMARMHCTPGRREVEQCADPAPCLPLAGTDAWSIHKGSCMFGYLDYRRATGDLLVLALILQSTAHCAGHFLEHSIRDGCTSTSQSLPVCYHVFCSY